jgi:AraC family transcriptional regulator of adaptative response/methylated-DNA-[protein]-cysteine methyltransferase
MKPLAVCAMLASMSLTSRTELIARACRAIETGIDRGAPPTLGTLARAARLSPFHFHRLFKQLLGVTPKGYAAAVRTQRLQERLPRNGSVSAAAFDSGFGSMSAAYRSGARTLGMPPRRFRAGAAGETIRFALGECSLGTVLVAATARGLCAVLLGEEPQSLLTELQRRFSRAQLIGADAVFERWVAQVIALIESPARPLALPLDIRGTAFQQRVWQALRNIAPGSTASYAQVAARIGAPRAVRAVAQACAANPLAVAIPCHRVVRTDGALSGYRWGVERKRQLLERESGAVAAALVSGRAARG